MKFINLKTNAKAQDALSLLCNHELVNERVKFDDKKGKPIFIVKETKNTVKIKCQMSLGNVKDNGFLEGTYFIGRLTENNGTSRLRGVILTAPIYHTFIALIMIVFVLRCIQLVAFNPVPIILLAFSFMMLRGEFEKQGTIERYLIRAVKRAEKK